MTTQEKQNQYIMGTVLILQPFTAWKMMHFQKQTFPEPIFWQCGKSHLQSSTMHKAKSCRRISATLARAVNRWAV